MNMKSFKIGDQQKPGVAKPSAKKTEPEAPSAGFPNIEALVEQAAPDLSGMDGRLAQLAELAKSAGSNKDKAAAKKAAVAYERTKDLVEHLFDTKARLAGKKP
jgi:hypothetical protein